MARKIVRVGECPGEYDVRGGNVQGECPTLWSAEAS